VSQPRNDDERLSALLDGRVDERQRRELLAHLVTSDDDYEVFSHAAIVLRQLEEQERGAEPQVADDEPQAHAPEPQVPVDEPLRIEEPPAPVAGPAPAGARPVPPSTRAGGWRKPALWAAPLVVAALALAAVWVSRNRASAADPVRVAARLDASGLPADWPKPNRWGLVRGKGAPAPTTPEEANARAVQAGAMLVDLAVVARAGNPAATGWLATKAVSRLEPEAGHGTPLWRIADRPGAPADSLERLLAQATNHLATRLGKGPLRLGAWAEAATIAARRHNAAFFEDGEKRAMLRRAERLAARDPDARPAVVRAAAAEPPNWAELEAALKDLVDKLGN
jgi:hypothetical protein